MRNYKDLFLLIKGFEDCSDRSAVEWILTKEKGLHWLNKLPDSVYRVSYEDLVENPQVTLQGILDFCELPQDRKMFDYACQTFNPVSAKTSLPINPIIMPSFNSTMTALGY